ncbi:glycosyltransferase family 4 protein [Rossellomorea sp. YZS02]|uniref:glycosyltransferase family 4 protein n=1 Tax=Rossellomorea sp. YZS02 TaxID=3097358 RepID=UPI002A0AFD06|nr:glycosyltransferase family 4 protein [Rossellomorea sp. YZS02]MDX8344150.1 glycosyltransferase family 4 protein [Rossellomorea sp. YZS02]
MKVCIIRNAEAKTNAGMLRVVDALTDGGYEPFFLSRNRSQKKGERKILESKYDVKDKLVENYEFQIPSKTGRGVSNISQLLVYQLIVFCWLLSNNKKFDSIHAFDLDAGIPSLIVTKLFKKPLVYHIADFYVDSRPGIPRKIKSWIRKLEYKIISSANVTIICTEERINQIKGSSPKKLEVIHNTPVNIGPEETETARSNKLNTKLNHTESFRLCYVGSLEEKRFIKSLINVVSQDQRIQLEIAGVGNLENYVSEASNQYSNVNFHGKVDYNRALDLYTTCDAMFAIYDPSIPNHKFSAPNKVYESMMLGKPIIVAKGTGIDKIVQSEKIGISINYSEKDFKESLDYLLRNPQIVNEMGERSKEVFKLYSWSTMKDKLIKIYNEI